MDACLRVSSVTESDFPVATMPTARWPSSNVSSTMKDGVRSVVACDLCDELTLHDGLRYLSAPAVRGASQCLERVVFAHVECARAQLRFWKRTRKGVTPVPAAASLIGAKGF